MMNERIIELAKQAGIAVWGDAVFMYDVKDTLDSTVVENFVESIVLECIAMADDFELEVNQRGLVDRMKQHFGVK